MNFTWFRVFSAAETLFAAISNLISHSSFRQQKITLKKAKIHFGEQLISFESQIFCFRSGCVKIILDKCSQVIPKLVVNFLVDLLPK